jgi:8-oxo-dGTP diphosphatase
LTLTAPPDLSIWKSCTPRQRRWSGTFRTMYVIIKPDRMKPKGTSLIFVNDQGQVLLLLRDNNPRIPCANMWDLPGGHVEEGETPRECICREMKEEMGLDLEGVEPFSVMEFEDRTEFVFWKGMNLAIDGIKLTEGQRLRWFSRAEAEETPLAFGFNDILAAFFREAPLLIDI